MSFTDNTAAVDSRNFGRVKILDSNVVNQIAAGEVVERPASVIKELIENSLDAAATDIRVVIENGGKSLMEVIDDGCGMARQDALVAVERFGTSKIKSIEDLFAIGTLGFRGEALPSIASVSRFTLSTRAAKSDGVEMRIEGGTLLDETERPLQNGTRVRVENLFFNVPARRRFLKTERSEEAAVRSVVEDMALAYPTVSFRLTADGKEVLSLPRATDALARAREMAIAGITPLVVTYHRLLAEGAITISGLICAPVEAPGVSSRLHLIVNGRVVRDRLLVRAVRDGYGNYLKGKQYPAGFIAIDLPPSEVDVNVHPQKAEVRFRSSSQIFGMIVSAVRRALGVTIPSQVEEVSQNETSTLEASGSLWNSLPLRNERETVGTPSSAKPIHQLRYVGQIFKCYLLFEGAEEFVLVDMHAAHERLRFFEIKSQLLAGEVRTQRLLVPEVIDIPQAKLDQCEAMLPDLIKLGFDCDRFGESSVIVRSVPAVLGALVSQDLFTELLELPEYASAEEVLAGKADAVIARLACHSSIRSGRELESEEAYALLERLTSAENSGLCPHGRPVSARLTKDDLEKMFGRVL